MSKVLCKLVIIGAILIMATHAYATTTADTSKITSASSAISDETDEATSYPEMVRIARIEIGVKTKQVRVFGETSSKEEIMATLQAGTALAGEWSDCIPYEKEGKIKSITLNPSWKPTTTMQRERKRKKLPPLKATPPGSKNNPLGKIKFYFFYDNINSLYGMHATNNPKSVGKRVSHGCVRLSDDDAFWIGETLLTQNGYASDELFERAAENPTSPIAKKLKDCPVVVYMKE